MRDRHHYLFIAFLVLLVWLPIPLGSNRPWAWSLMQIGILLILALWAIAYLRRPYPLPRAVRAARWPLMVLGLWGCYLVMQIVPLPSAVVQSLSPSTFELVRYAADAPPASMTLSVDRAATGTEILKAVSYAAFFFLTLVLIDGRQRLRLSMWVLFCVGLVEAVYGILASFGGDTLGLWNPVHAHLNAVGGTYVNRNHFAGLMELTIPLGLGLILYRLRPPRHHPHWRARLRAITRFVMEGRIALPLFVVILFAGLFLSTSRGGAFALFAALGIVVFIAAVKAGGQTREMRFVPGLLLLAVMAGVWFGVEGLNEKLLRTVHSGFEIDRTPVWQASLKLIENQPVFGSGAGSFRWLLPLYRSAEIGPLFYDHAHNDYLEVLAEQGAIGFGLLATAVALLLLGNIRAYTRRRDPLMRAALFASVTASLALLLHGLVDFNFQIPANAGYFNVLVAMGVVAGTLAGGGRRVTSGSEDT